MLYIASAAVLGRPSDVPHITHKWLQCFRQCYHISLRLPNKRWKVPRDVFEQRLRIMWMNLIRVRYWILLATGEEPEAIGNFDQKPFHVNESGSKLQKTLDFKGGCVQLKELHSATRERWTAQTYCTSDRARALSGPPLELLFKGGAQIEAKLVVELDRLRASGSLCKLPQVSVATSPTGSYNTADILRYLDLVLDKWGARQALADPLVRCVLRAPVQGRPTHCVGTRVFGGVCGWGLHGGCAALGHPRPLAVEQAFPIGGNGTLAADGGRGSRLPAAA